MIKRILMAALYAAFSFLITSYSYPYDIYGMLKVVIAVAAGVLGYCVMKLSQDINHGE